MPPPEPRSSTTSPGARSASAVGFPHPSDASTASSGIPQTSVASYRLRVTGSEPDPPQQDTDPPPQFPACLVCSTWRAIAPYFACTVSFNASLIRSSGLKCNQKKLMYRARKNQG